MTKYQIRFNRSFPMQADGGQRGNLITYADAGNCGEEAVLQYQRLRDTLDGSVQLTLYGSRDCKVREGRGKATMLHVST